MWTIQQPFIFIAILPLNVVYCFDSESLEANRIEVNPFYDTVIYSDIADIINGFETNHNTQYDAFPNSDSESEENIEDLLAEYQRYLEKAHKQRVNYIEKKTKNKVPPVQREKYSKAKPTPDTKYNDLYYANNYYNPGPFKFAQTSFNNPLDVFIPLNAKAKTINKFELSTTTPKNKHEDIVPLENVLFNEKKIFKIPPIIHKPPFESLKSCYCKNGQLPCDCNCKQCIMPFEQKSRNHLDQMKLHSFDDEKSVLPNSILYENFGREHYIDDYGRDLPENTLNIRIKVDLQLPKAQGSVGKYFKFHNRDKTLERDDYNSKELSPALSEPSVPLPYFNFPIPMDVFGYKKTVKYSKHDNSPIHKITIHKKKKSKVNNNNKKHRKKVITFHNIKLEPQQVYTTHFADKQSDNYKQENISKIMLHNNLAPNLTQTEINKTDENVTVTQTEGSIYVMVNISSSRDNGTDDIHKLENSIETDYTKTISNETTKMPVIITREKRAAPVENTGNKYLNKQTSIKSEGTTAPHDKSEITKNKNIAKKSEKGILSDTELLYWPNIIKNLNPAEILYKNITMIILENEHKKSKLNMSKETLRYNHTRALEQAIFGVVDWDNVDAVAPAFMSFVGKYISGVLTFCSQSVCHSMKCASRACIHRVCLPADRLNNKGHCTGASTDSVASMESIMDLPSNIAFEIVDILQNKLLGMLFGKATLCINSKCITFVASKKNFIKSRCSVKELNTIGHCSNTKNVKIM